MNEINEAPQRNFLASGIVFGSVSCFANTKRTNVNFRGIMRFAQRVMINLGTDFYKLDEWGFLLQFRLWTCTLFLSVLQFAGAHFPQRWQINPPWLANSEPFISQESDTLSLPNSFCVFFFCQTWQYPNTSSVMLLTSLYWPFVLVRAAVYLEAIPRQKVQTLAIRRVMLGQVLGGKNSKMWEWSFFLHHSAMFYVKCVKKHWHYLILLL